MTEALSLIPTLPVVPDPATPRLLVAGLVSAQTMSWRYRGKLYVSVVVKASFALRPDGPMVPRGVRSIAVSQGDGLAAYPSDCVPFRPHTDVVVVDRPAAMTETARLVLSRGQERLVDKELGAGSFAPVSPAARRELAGGDVPTLGAMPIALSEHIDWSCFQCAPADQRVPSLEGDEWLQLEDMHPAHPTLRCQLPRECGYVFVALPELEGDDAPWASLALTADLLAIEVERMSAVITWRGYLELADVDALRRLRVVAGVTAGRPPAPPPARDIPLLRSVAEDLAALLSSSGDYARSEAPDTVPSVPEAPASEPVPVWARDPSEPELAAIPDVSPRQPVPDVLSLVYRSFA